MPTYKFHDHTTKKTWIEFMTISERTQFLADNSQVEQLVHGFPGAVDSVKIGRTKPADGFRDLLKQIKKNNIGSDLNTFK